MGKGLLRHPYQKICAVHFGDDVVENYLQIFTESCGWWKSVSKALAFQRIFLEAAQILPTKQRSLDAHIFEPA